MLRNSWGWCSQMILEIALIHAWLSFSVDIKAGVYTGLSKRMSWENVLHIILPLQQLHLVYHKLFCDCSSYILFCHYKENLLFRPGFELASTFKYGRVILKKTHEKHRLTIFFRNLQTKQAKFFKSIQNFLWNCCFSIDLSWIHWNI